MSDGYEEQGEDLARLEEEFGAHAAAAEAAKRAEEAEEAEGGEAPGEAAPAGAERSERRRGREGGRSAQPLPERLWRIKSRHSHETSFAWLEGGELAEGQTVVASTRYGKDLCLVQGLVANPGRLGPDELVKVDRIASPEDLSKAQANEEKEKRAYEVCRQKIDQRGLPMKLVSAHYLLEESKILFFFSAESRVDFRELVKDLVAVFKTRIELRQIGVRDEARVLGGCGVCGRVLCCHGVSDKLTPVSIKMAKDQNLSLNSMKISGPCGRLLCCLAYEYGFYRDARRELPGEGVRFPYDGSLFRVVEVNALGGSVKAAGEDGRLLEIPASRFVHSEGKWRVREEEKA